MTASVFQMQNCCLCSPSCQFRDADHKCTYCSECKEWKRLADKVERQRRKCKYWKSIDPTAPYMAGIIESEKSKLHRLENELAEFEGII